jgi:hypothetical protein
MIRRVLEAINEDEHPPTAEYEKALESRGWKLERRKNTKAASYGNMWYVESVWVGPVEGLRITIETEFVGGDPENEKRPPDYVYFDVESQYPLMRAVGQDPHWSIDPGYLDRPTISEMMREIRGVKKRFNLKYRGKKS